MARRSYWASSSRASSACLLSSVFQSRILIFIAFYSGILWLGLFGRLGGQLGSRLGSRLGGLVGRLGRLGRLGKAKGDSALCGVPAGY